MGYIQDFENEIRNAKKKDLDAIVKRYYSQIRSKCTIRTCSSHFSRMRKIFGKLHGKDHPVMDILKLGKDEYDRLNEEYRKSVEETDIKPFNSELYIAVCNEFLMGYGSIHESYLKLCLGIAGLTGRRWCSEVLCAGKFEVRGKRRLMFSGQAKSREGKPYIIPCLADSGLIMECWQELRSVKSVVSPSDFDKKTLNEIMKITQESPNIGIEEHHRLFQKHRDTINRISRRLTSNSKEINRIVKKHFAEVGIVKAHDLRALYAETAYKLYGRSTKSVYISKILGHADYDYSTAQSYQEYSNR